MGWNPARAGTAAQAGSAEAGGGELAAAGEGKTRCSLEPLCALGSRIRGQHHGRLLGRY
jgi:hypothetical protein